MLNNDKSPQYMTSVELEEAIRRHREFTKKLLAEARSRRANSSQQSEDGKKALQPDFPK